MSKSLDSWVGPQEKISYKNDLAVEIIDFSNKIDHILSSQKSYWPRSICMQPSTTFYSIQSLNFLC